MKNKKELLIEKKLITEWIVRAYQWIDRTIETFAQAGAQVTDKLPSAYSPVEKWYWGMGRRLEPSETLATIKKLGMKFETVAGAEAAICYIRGAMWNAQQRIDAIDLCLSDSQRPSCAGDKGGKAAADSQRETPANKTGRAQAKASNDARGHA